jgi:hypothetical protein
MHVKERDFWDMFIKSRFFYRHQINAAMGLSLSVSVRRADGRELPRASPPLDPAAACGCGGEE